MNKLGGVYIDILFNKKELVDTEQCLPDEFYKNETETATSLISLSIIRELFENKLISDKEYNYITSKYGLLSLT